MQIKFDIPRHDSYPTEILEHRNTPLHFLELSDLCLTYQSADYKVTVNVFYGFPGIFRDIETIDSLHSKDLSVYLKDGPHEE